MPQPPWRARTRVDRKLAWLAGGQAAAAKYRALITSALNSLAAAGPMVADTGGVEPDPDPTFEKILDSDSPIKKNWIRIPMRSSLNFLISI